MSDLLASSKALLELDKDGALVPHGLGGHGRTCLEWCVAEIERLRARLKRIENVSAPPDYEDSDDVLTRLQRIEIIAGMEDPPTSASQ